MLEYFPEPEEPKVACQCSNCERDIYYGEKVLHFNTYRIVKGKKEPQEFILCWDCVIDNTKVMED
jgi:hypothetical protein